MSGRMTEHIRLQMEKKETEDLIKIWTKNDRNAWSDEAFDIIKDVLKYRNIPIPQQHPVEMFYGKYRKVRMRPFKAYGNYRGKGSIEFTNGSFRICGSHVMSLGSRWIIGLAIFFGSLILTAGYFAPGFLLIYLIMEYVWLKSEDTTVTYSNVINYVSNPEKHLVGIDFHGPQWCKPVVLKSDKWSEILSKLREIIPDRDASLMVVPPLSKGRAIWLSSLVFIGLYLLFFFIVIGVVGLIMTSQGVNSIPAIKNGFVRNVTWFISFGFPLFLSFIFSRKHYRKKRIATRIDGSEAPAMSEGLTK